MTHVFVLMLGLITGSFLNVCIYRIPLGRLVIFPPSSCPDCGNRLNPWHMIPVFSYMLLKNRCGFCGKAISAVYPLVELITGLMFVGLFHKFGYGILFLKYTILISLLIVVVFIDLKTQIIPDSLVVHGLVLGMIFILTDKSCSFEGNIIGMLAGSGLLFLIAIFSDGGMGGGDVKLMAVIGLFLGWEKTLLTLFIAFVSGGITGLWLLLSGKKKRKDAVAFGPFLTAASVIVIFTEKLIISFYLNLI